MDQSELPWDELGLSPTQKELLLGLGASSIPALLGMILAAPKEFGAFFGQEETHQLQERLDAKLTPSERAMFAEPIVAHGGLGALMDPPRINIGPS